MVFMKRYKLGALVCCLQNSYATALIKQMKEMNGPGQTNFGEIFSFFD